MNRSLARFALAGAVLLLLFAAPQLLASNQLALGPQTPPASTSSRPQQASTSPETKTTAVGNVTQYTLPPALDRKAHRLGQISFWGALIGTLYSWLILLLILNWRLAPKYRDWAERASRIKFLQAAIFAPLLLLTLAFLTIPLDIAQHWISRRFGLSIQNWGSWSWDWAKQEIFFLVAGTFLVWLLYSVIRRSPRRWWLYFWLISLPLMAFLVFVQPVVVDPMFHKFVPLEQKDPALANQLEDLVHRAGQSIPPDRMFWMDAGAKTTELNAYVTGIGTSKRIVVWNTTIHAMDTPQIVFVIGHEMGHYVLNHIWKGMAIGAAGLFVLFYLVFRVIGPLLQGCSGRFLGGRSLPAAAGFSSDIKPAAISGASAPEFFDSVAAPAAQPRLPGAAASPQNAEVSTRWAIRSVGDWASLPAMLLLVSILSFIATPIGSAVSRYFEHQADQYGLEVTHGVTPDSGQVAAQSFQILGAIDLADPRPNPVDVFLFYSHPPIPDRIRFSLTYAPWSHGRNPEFVK
ncbi:MAG: M48 family metallopeptidase [Candidatus Acidiferrales bacterium]